jgi:OPA family sugar phosphate sensor protein UhpC-like MFS transporter
VSTETHRPQDARYESWRWQIFAITWLAYAGFYLTRLPFAVAKIELGKPSGLSLTPEQMGWIDGAALTAYAGGQFFWGVCGDRFGTRRVILAGMLGSVLAGLGMGAATDAGVLTALSGVQGLCQASGWAPLTKNMGQFFSQRERGTVLGLWCTNYALGSFVASVFAGAAGEYWGWRYAFYAPAATLLLIWILFFLMQRDRPEDVGLPPIEQYHGEAPAVLEQDETPAEEPEGSWKVILEVCRNPMVLLLAAVYFFMKPARYAILLWAPKYLNEKLGTEMLQSGALGALFQLAGPLSVLAAGILSDRVFGARRNPVSVICLFLLALLLGTLDELPATPFMLGACLFLIGLLLYAPDSLVSGTAAIDFGTKKGASTATGLINGFGSVAAIAGGTMPGLLHDRLGWHGLFQILAASVFISGCLLLPWWNAQPSAGKATGTPR